jgi:hypothetical protein
MSRNVSSPMLAVVTSNFVRPAFMAALTFRSGTRYVWTGIGNLVYGGNTFRGVGSLGKIGTVSEGTQVRADGTTVSLSGIDPALLSDSLTDIQVGAPAIVYFATVDANSNIVGTPYTLFSGLVDKPLITPGMDDISISLALESLLSNLQRPTQRRWTAADQQLDYPDDSAFNWVEILNDQALRWGS